VNTSGIPLYEQKKVILLPQANKAKTGALWGNPKSLQNLGKNYPNAVWLCFRLLTRGNVILRGWEGERWFDRAAFVTNSAGGCSAGSIPPITCAMTASASGDSGNTAFSRAVREAIDVISGDDH